LPNSASLPANSLDRGLGYLSRVSDRRTNRPRARWLAETAAARLLSTVWNPLPTDPEQCRQAETMARGGLVEDRQRRPVDAIPCRRLHHVAVSVSSSPENHRYLNSTRLHRRTYGKEIWRWKCGQQASGSAGVRWRRQQKTELDGDERSVADAPLGCQGTSQVSQVTRLHRPRNDL